MPNKSGTSATTTDGSTTPPIDKAIDAADKTLKKVKDDKSKMQATRMKKADAAALVQEFEGDFVWTVQESDTSTKTSAGTSGYVTLMISRTQPGSD